MTMTTAIIIGVGVMAVGMTGSMYMQQQSLEQQKAAQAAYENRLNEALKQSKLNEQAFTTKLDQIDQNFDPYQMDEAMASLYQAAIRPLEVDFDQNQLPELRNSFNVGADGMSLNSGTAKMAEASARRDLSFQSAQLRAQERDKAITRAYTDYDRRVNSLQLGYNAKQNTVNTSLGVASGMYGAASDTASATAAFGGSIMNAASGLTSAGIQAGTLANQTKFVNAYQNTGSSIPELGTWSYA